jgi:predicted DCC family thiol-disulfide oxidoreductase YuxK
VVEALTRKRRIAMNAGEQAASVGKASAGKLAILYDGSCEMCRASVDGIRKFDNSGQMEPLDLQHEEVRAQFPELKLENLLEELHVVDESGRVYRGARAINEILRRQRGLKGYLAYLWYVPGYAWVADRQYKRIAATRYARDARGRLKGQPAAEQ